MSSPAAAAPPRPRASVADDTLTVTGTSQADRIALRLQPGQPGTLQVDVGDDGTSEFAFARASFSRIHVDARNGDDQVRIDQVNGAFADESITVAGGPGADDFQGGDGAEVFLGGQGSDTADGNRGADQGLLGPGDDSFRWDPGDGSDVVEGHSGFDTLDFNGAAVNENMSLAANGAQAVFLRDAGNIRMDMNGVERLDLTTLGGVDTFTAGDLSGTDVRVVDVDLSSPTGGGDGQADTVTVDGTASADAIRVTTDAARVAVEGLHAEVRIAGSETADRLQINGLAGDDDVEVDGTVAALITVAIDLGSDQI